MFMFTRQIEFDTSVRILFILKNRESSWGEYSGSGNFSSGLFNSANFAKEYLVSKGVDAHLEHAIDNNCIDRLVTQHRPTHVIIEAFWVIPEKFDVLTKLHPSVKWIIRDHSHTPFLATEGIAFGWAMEYLEKPQVYLSCNHREALRDMRALAAAKFPFWDECDLRSRVIFHPNLYEVESSRRVRSMGDKVVLDVGCFGAIRPLKNQLIQAVAAIDYCRENNLYLRFHINATRMEGNGDPVLKNLRSIFDHTLNGELVEHGWLDHNGFLSLCAKMDIALQVSYTETFNIVSADMASQETPLVTSGQIEWVDGLCHADPNSSLSIKRAMGRVLNNPKITRRSLERLKRESERNSEFWKLWP